MKEYPSIPRSFENISNCYVFDKLDGNNIRAEWAKKKGWTKFGSRHQLIDETNLQFAGCIPLFRETLAEPIEKVAVDMKWERVTCFMEFWGPGSLCGVRVPSEQMTLSLFDVNPYKQGILPPLAFLKLFGNNDKISTPRFLGNFNWTKGFVDRVRNDEVPDITFEGVVGKAVGPGNQITMSKAKTQRWLDAIAGRYNAADAAKLINS